MDRTSPIAVLDSGAGGLSVVSALRRVMPHEAIHYFADTAHFPYGTKSPELITHLARRMARTLKDLSSCKLLVVACHTISTWCLKEIESDLGIPVVGMVMPSIAGLRSLIETNDALRSVGIISTKATVLSRAYQRAWSIIDPHARATLTEHPAGMLVNLVEEPDIDFSTIATMVDYVLPPSIKESDAVLIGCTHFSALYGALAAVLKPQCHVVDASVFAANAVVTMLSEQGLLNLAQTKRPIVAYVSDNPERFQIIARRFIEEHLMIEWLRNYARS